MALNQPYSDEYVVEDIVENNISDLLDELKTKEGLDLQRDDILYSLFDREEYLGVLSANIYPDEDLPDKFGVYRGYNGGGMHGGLIKTEVYRMKENRQARAQRILAIFEKYFWQILKQVDKADERIEPKEDWDRVTI